VNIRRNVVLTADRRQYTLFFKFKSWLLCRTKWQIAKYDWSDHLSIKLQSRQLWLLQVKTWQYGGGELFLDLNISLSAR